MMSEIKVPEVLPQENQSFIMARAELDTQIVTAKSYPRNMKACMAAAREIVTYSQEIAQSCFFSLPRSDKEIKGPSVRLAEIFVSCWGNLKCASRIISNDGKNVIAEAVVIDLEKNNQMGGQCSRSIVDKYGKTYKPDMQTVTMQAAQAIALRNAIFKVIPKALIDELYEVARKFAIGDLSSIGERVSKGIEYFGKLGITEDRILAFLSKESQKECGAPELEYLLGIQTSIKEGHCALDDAFSTNDERYAGTNTQEKLDILRKNK